MDRRAIAVVLVVLAVLAPTWFVAMHGEPPSEEIRIDQSVSEIRPLDGFVDTPNKLSPAQVGVVVWVALLALLGAMAFFHRFMNRAARPDPGEGASGGGGAEATATDGGHATGSAEVADADGWTTFPWIETDYRWVVEYHDASDAVEGLVAMGGLTVLTITFAALFTAEYLTLARTQYFGIYTFGMFMSLTGLTVSYYAWFMPHVEVAERRDH
ncbi:hypothetical protein GRX01_02965 [Halobaculum sp. WSA2]|uniref:Uncharacterized protein n=1 Tax=Halobaculum saliterrae TaxID=2073113 RepID=A0A6B0SN37_9EURY|nr:hypothetical protein [Halobaculum saliterrae]MXR40318.1 hypothetical protein [Halobaculum saliterrae]